MYYKPTVEYIAKYLVSSVFVWKEGKISYACSYLGENTVIQDVILRNSELLQYLLEHAGTECPTISFVNGTTSFIHFQSKEGIFIAGPFRILFTEYSSAASHVITIESLNDTPLPEGASVVPFEAVRCALLLFNTVNETDVSENECLTETFSTRSINKEISRKTVSNLFDSRENQRDHNSYELEQLLMRCIEHGDIEGMKKVWEFPSIEKLGVTAKDPVRNGKNLANFNVVLAGRAAIRGGVPSETVFSIIDASVMQIEELQDMMVLQSLVEDIQLNFAQMVNDLKKENRDLSDESYLVSEAKSYISLHLHEKLTVTDTAKAIGVHPNYLSSLFKRSEGIPTHEYIMNQKILLAENLLVYSSYTYLEISQYLAFSSQSHLGSVFKKVTGLTMKEYRDTYRPEGN